MEPATLALLSGVAANTVGLFILALSGGRFLGRIETKVDQQGAEIGRLRDWRHDFSNLSVRVEVLEDAVAEFRRIPREID